MVYNLKIKKFANNKQQIILYDYPIYRNNRITSMIADKAAFTRSNRTNKEDKTDTDKLHSILNSKNRTIKAIYDLSRANNWQYFVTMTFNKQKVNRYNYDDCIHAMQLYIKTLKKHCPVFKYLIVPELHKDGAWHLHGLFSDIDKNYLTDSGRTTKNGDIIYNLITWDSGWSTATEVKNNDKVVRYMTKYITKELCLDTLYRNRYYYSRNLDKPEEKEIYYSIHQIDVLLSKISDSMLYAKTIEFNDSNIIYLEVENCSEIFDYKEFKLKFEEI